MSELTMTDHFCGAGGSSSGAAMVPGVEVTEAANHWQLAVDTHNTNHPNTNHICADLSQIHPALFRRTNLGWFSPSCTKHSIAQGKKRADAQPDLFGEVLPDAAAERSRATMWDVVRFSEYHLYEAVIVENVVDVYHWPPFRSWLLAMESLGYLHETVWLNSMHAQLGGPGAPQSRDRIYIVFWRKGNRRPALERVTRPHAECPECGPVRAMQSWKNPDRPQWGRYRSQYIYRCPNVKCRNRIVEPIARPAAEIIDWALPATRLGDRAKPLADKTMARIRAGIDRYWGPFITEHTHEYRVRDIAQPLQTIRASGNHFGLAIPVEGREGKTAVPVDQPLRTMTTRNETGVAYPAFLTQFRDRVRDLDPYREPLNTVVADGANHALVQGPAFIAELRGGGSVARPVTDPLATVTASGNHHGLVTADIPPRCECEGFCRCSYAPSAAIYSGAKSGAKPLTADSNVERHGLIMRNNGVRGGHPARHTTPASEPVRTVTTAGHQSLIAADSLPVDLDDVRFRMLEPSEIARAMDFPTGYTILGNRREQVRMSGNAVTPPAARDLVMVVAESLGVAA